MYLRRMLGALAMMAALLATPASGQHAIEVIALRHRTAEQVLPALRLLVEPGATLTGQGTRLIVRTSPANLAELRGALEAIDRPFRRLQILVRYGDAMHSAARDVAAGVSRNRIEVQAADRRTASVERVDQRIQVLEGGRAFIASGRSTPIFDGSVTRETATGFEAVPRLFGDRVQVEIVQRRESLERQSGLSTTVSARLGEWFEVGGTTEDAARRDRGLLSERASRGAESRRVWLKVEELRP
jgi:type II secretory pathway component GspD/PulD (secretin)